MNLNACLSWWIFTIFYVNVSYFSWYIISYIAGVSNSNHIQGRMGPVDTGSLIKCWFSIPSEYLV